MKFNLQLERLAGNKESNSRTGKAVDRQQETEEELVKRLQKKKTISFSSRLSSVRKAINYIFDLPTRRNPLKITAFFEPEYFFRGLFFISVIVGSMLLTMSLVNLNAGPLGSTAVIGSLKHFVFGTFCFITSSYFAHKIYKLGNTRLTDEQRNWLQLYCREVSRQTPNMEFMTKAGFGKYVKQAYTMCETSPDIKRSHSFATYL